MSNCGTNFWRRKRRGHLVRFTLYLCLTHSHHSNNLQRLLAILFSQFFTGKRYDYWLLSPLYHWSLSSVQNSFRKPMSKMILHFCMLLCTRIELLTAHTSNALLLYSYDVTTHCYTLPDVENNLHRAPSVFEFKTESKLI